MHTTSRLRPTILLLLSLLIAFTFIFYMSTVQFGYVMVKDYTAVRANFFYNPFPSGILTPFSDSVTHSIFYRPMVDVSYILNSLISHLSSWGYHLVNIFFHSIVATLVFLLFIRLGYHKFASFFATLIFIIHPLSVNAAVWIAGRTESLAALFILVSLHCFISFVSSSLRKIVYLALHLVFFLAALFTKETGLIIPLLCVSYIFISKAKISNLYKKILFLGWLNLILIYLWLYINYVGGIANWNEHFYVKLDYLIYAFIQNLPTALIFFGRSIIPYQLSPLFTINTMSILIGLVTLLAFYFLIRVIKNKLKMFIISFGILIFLFPLMLSWIVLNPQSPSSSNPIPNTWYILEGRMYLPLVGVLLIFLEIFKSKIFNNKIFILILSMYFAFLSGVNMQYRQVFANDKLFINHVQSYASSIFPQQ